MGQLGWIFIDDFDRRYDVGIYHGNDSGNLMIYCNNHVVLIDFDVNDDKKYSFYLNENLCEVEVEKQKKTSTFGYSFEVNEKADTPLNRMRKKYKRKENMKVIFCCILYFVLIGAFCAYMMTF